MMKSKPLTDSSFFAKMLLLFALVFLAHPGKRKGLEGMLKNIFHMDSVHQVGQIHSSKVIATPVSLPR